MEYGTGCLPDVLAVEQMRGERHRRKLDAIGIVQYDHGIFYSGLYLGNGKPAVEFALTENDYIEEAFVHEDESLSGEDTIIKAEIYPNYVLIKQDMERELDDDEMYDFIKRVVDDINDRMPPYKRVKRIGIRKTEFVKTTTRKIKRFIPENLQEQKGPEQKSE